MEVGVYKDLDSSAIWWRGRTGPLTAAIMLDFLKLVVGSTMTVGEITASVRLGRHPQWIGSNGSTSSWLPEAAVLPPSSGTRCWSAQAIRHSSSPSTTRWNMP